MRASAMLIGLVLGLAATPAFAQKEPLKEGDKAPPLEAENWFNLPKGMKALAPSDLKGQIVIVVFWAEHDPRSQRSVPFLSDLQKKYRAKGVILVGLSDDGESKVTPFITKYKASYIIGSGASICSRKFGIKEIPWAFLIDPEGKIAWAGSPAAIDDPLTKLLLEKPAKKAGFLAETTAAESFKKADKLAKEKKYLDAIEEYELITKNFKETKEAEKAASELKKLKSNSKIMDMVNRAKADKEANGWLDVARICRQYGDKEDAIKYYERIIKKYAETDAGRFARSEIAPLKKLKKSADDEEEDEDQGSDNGKAKEKDKAKAKDKGKAKPEKEQEKKKEKKEKEEGDEDEGDEESGGE